MAITITPDTKTDVTISNTSKSSGSTIAWTEGANSWEESRPSKWDSIRTPFTKDSKNSVSITNDTKN